MSQPLFGRTAGTDDSVQCAQKYKLDFIDLHFRGNEAKLSQTMNEFDAMGVKYVPNFEGAPVSWVPSNELKTDLAHRSGFLDCQYDRYQSRMIGLAFTSTPKQSEVATDSLIGFYSVIQLLSI